MLSSVAVALIFNASPTNAVVNVEIEIVGAILGAIEPANEETEYSPNLPSVNEMGLLETKTSAVPVVFPNWKFRA